VWINDYELYAIASGLREKPANIQYAVFLHVIGESARSIYKGFRFAGELQARMSLQYVKPLPTTARRKRTR